MDACAPHSGRGCLCLPCQLLEQGMFATFYLGISKHTTEFREYSHWFLYIPPCGRACL